VLLTKLLTGIIEGEDRPRGGRRGGRGFGGRGRGGRGGRGG